MSYRINLISLQVSNQDINIKLFNIIRIFVCLDLQTVKYDGPTNFNTSHLIFHVIPHSDFDNIELTCIVGGDKLPPCSNLILQNNTCSTTLAVNGTLGCDYNCFFTTKKADYTDEPSPNISLTVCKHLFI